MPPETYSLTVDQLTVEVTRKHIKHFHLKVHRLDGRVRVSAPWRMSEAMIRSAIVSRLDWIRRHVERIESRPQWAPPAFVSGERHWFRGRPYELAVMERPGRTGVWIGDDGIIELRVQPGSDAAQRQAVLEKRHRSHLREVVPGLIRDWETVMGVKVAEWRIKRMKTRWGTCNPSARRIWLNLELAKRSPACLEYVVVHEMTHLLERSHNARFHGLMDRFLPDWRARSDALRAVDLE